MTGDGLSRGLSDMWRSVVLFLPSALTFLAIVFAGYLLARLARTLTGKALRRAGFDRIVTQGPAGRLIRPGTPSATDVCARLAFFVVLLFALQLAFGIWGPNPASELINALVSWLPQVFVAIVIVVVTTAIARAAHDLTLAVLGSLAYAPVMAKAVTAVIVTLGVIAGLDQIGIATSVTRPLLITILATVAGVIIVGVGGGLIRPMQQRWEGWLDRAATESAAIRSQARAYAEERARQTASPAAADPAADTDVTASSGSPEPGDFSGPAGRVAAGSAGPGAVQTWAAGSHDVQTGAPGSHGVSAAAESTGPAEDRASTAEGEPARPDRYSEGHPSPPTRGAGTAGGSRPGAGAVEESRPGAMTARDARRAGAEDLAAEVRRAASLDRSPTAQAVAAGGAVAADARDHDSADAARAEVHGQEGADAARAEVQGSDESGAPDREAGAVTAAADSRGIDTPGVVAAAGDSNADRADTAAYPEENEDWSWEQRWAEEERRAGERSGEATVIVDASEAGIVDDRPHLIPGFDRDEDRLPADDDDPTIFVHIGTAETTLLTPGVRPASGFPEPAADDDPTIAGHDRDAVWASDEARSDRHDGAPVMEVSGEPTTDVFTTTTDSAEPTTSFLARGSASGGLPEPPTDADPAADDTTTSFFVGAPGSVDSTVSSSDGSGDDTTSFVVGGADSGDPTMSLEGGGAGSGDPTMSLEGGGADDGEPTTVFALADSAGGGSDIAPDELPTTVMTAGTDAGETTVVRSGQAGDTTEDRTAESPPPDTAGGGPVARHAVAAREAGEPAGESAPEKGDSAGRER